jgi:hypothetical protein
MPMEAPPDFATLSLSDIARLAADKKLPPVEQWHPDHCGHSDMRVARDGTWFHQGSPIGREAMVRLFSSILRREPDGSFVLVTPVEKLTIDVEDAPFVALEVRTEGYGTGRTLAFRLNTGDLVTAGADHAIRMRAPTDAAETDAPHPYLVVRGALEALIVRSVYYEMANLALDEDADPPGLWSDGAFFRLDGAA